MDHGRVEPPPALDIVADPAGRAGRQRQPRAAGAAVEIHHEVESRPPEAHREPGIFADSPPAPALLDNDQLVDLRVVRHDGRGFALDEYPRCASGNVRFSAPMRGS